MWLHNIYFIIPSDDEPLEQGSTVCTYIICTLHTYIQLTIQIAELVTIFSIIETRKVSPVLLHLHDLKKTR